MLFQDAPPDTSTYMIAGYAVFFVISAIYLVSLAVRRRNLELDLKTLESIEAASTRAPVRLPAPAASRARAKATRLSTARRKPVRKKVTRSK